MCRTEKLRSGVSQGGVISSFLFCWYLKDVPQLRLNVIVVCYADDITVYCSTKKLSKTSMDTLMIFKSFFHRKHMFSLPSKCSAVLLSTSHSDIKEDLDVVLGTDWINTVNGPTLLGVKADQSLTFQDHVKYLGLKEPRRETISCNH